MQKTLLSGIKPTGELHIGNYFGAMRQFVDFQDKYRSFIFIANYHALTSVANSELLRKLSLEIAMDFLAIGLDPKKTTLFLQSDVPEVTELAWIFNNITTVPYLMRAHAFKDAEAKNKEVNVGLFDYPILMAADILIYGSDVVPVGQDQKQHVEIARDTAQKFNRIFGNTFKVPEPIILDEVKTVIGTDGRKMSKSYGNGIGLFASDEEIKKAVMSIPTDSKSVNEPKDPTKCNVFAFHELLGGKDLPELKKRYLSGTIGYKESKDILVERMKAFIGPMRKRREEIAKDPDAVLKILRDGGEVVRKEAKKMMKEVREKVGLI
ncbi:MAG: tryptophan--tRNA ligase [Candidatus Pacebacteria bacterium]|nr:tryptophan--tRNA ligase [Candidatus Paceibacterota bacterium]